LVRPAGEKESAHGMMRGSWVGSSGWSSETTVSQPLLCDFFHKVFAALNVRSLEVVPQRAAKIGNGLTSRTSTVGSISTKKSEIPDSWSKSTAPRSQPCPAQCPTTAKSLSVIDRKDKQSAPAIASDRPLPQALDGPASTRRSKRAFLESHHLVGSVATHSLAVADRARRTHCGHGSLRAGRASNRQPRGHHSVAIERGQA
jgi:hypothetical protein